ncbi:hypothetical protein Bpfe_000734 [Biomphalaria pfeifferi]|uniref:Uncharacterized protein n=1 Tax=Biomphalaria pfeifferi TaxID=112525 RepID=A0AAD8FLM7_BIOPF|nr:hypothetical protein Bpfe_000734 [Biomphalaria pfeifferi]
MGGSVSSAIPSTELMTCTEFFPEFNGRVQNKTKQENHSFISFKVKVDEDVMHYLPMTCNFNAVLCSLLTKVKDYKFGQGWKVFNATRVGLRVVSVVYYEKLPI